MRNAVLSLILCFVGWSSIQAAPGNAVKFTSRGWSFEGPYTIHSAQIQSDGKIVLGGDFLVRVPVQSFVTRLAKTRTVYVNLKNIVRVNADGTVDKTYLVSAAQASIEANGGWADENQGIYWGPNGVVRSVVLDTGSAFVKFVTGEFTQFGQIGTINVTNCTRLLELDSSGSLVAGFPKTPTGIENTVRGLLNIDDTNVVGYGDFTQIDLVGQNYAFLGTNSTATAAATALANAPVDFAMLATTGTEAYLAGEFTTYDGAAAPFIARVDVTDITLDGSFVPEGTGPNARVRGLAQGSTLAPTNVVLVGEFTSFNGNAKGRIARVDDTGTLDLAFPAANGVNSSGANGPIFSIIKLSDDRYLIAGNFTSYNGVPANGMARLESDGKLDTTFSAPGNLSPATIRGIAVNPVDESFLVYGTFAPLIPGTKDAGFARIQGGRSPVILVQPANTSVDIGDPLTLTVTASDNSAGLGVISPLTYQWQKNGRNIPGATSASYVDPSATPTDAGTYRVIVSTNGLSVTSTQVFVVITNPFTGFIPTAGFRAEGIVGPDPVLNQDLGGKISFLVDRFGVASGTLQMGAPFGSTKPASLKFTGQFNSLGVMTASIARTGLPVLGLTLNMNLAGAPADFDFVSTPSALTDGTNTATVLAWNSRWSRTTPATAFAGTYNVGLETNGGDLAATIFGLPQVCQGFGYFTMGIDAGTGTARMAGTLSDGTPFSGTGIVWGNTPPVSSVPLWVPLYGGRGALQGLVNIDSVGVDKPVTADLQWIKPAGLAKVPDPFGFGLVALTASANSGLYKSANVVFAAPPGNLSVTFDDGGWTAGDGGLSAPFTQLFSVVSGRATADLPNPHTVRLTLDTRSGQISGTFVDSGRTVRFQSVILTQGGLALRGFYIMPNLPSGAAYYVGGSVSN